MLNNNVKLGPKINLFIKTLVGTYAQFNIFVFTNVTLFNSLNTMFRFFNDKY